MTHATVAGAEVVSYHLFLLCNTSTIFMSVHLLYQSGKKQYRLFLTCYQYNIFGAVPITWYEVYVELGVDCRLILYTILLETLPNVVSVFSVHFFFLVMNMLLFIDVLSVSNSICFLQQVSEFDLFTLDDIDSAFQNIIRLTYSQNYYMSGKLFYVLLNTCVLSMFSLTLSCSTTPNFWFPQKFVLSLYINFCKEFCHSQDYLSCSLQVNHVDMRRDQCCTNILQLILCDASYKFPS